MTEVQLNEAIRRLMVYASDELDMVDEARRVGDAEKADYMQACAKAHVRRACELFEEIRQGGSALRREYGG